MLRAWPRLCWRCLLLWRCLGLLGWELMAFNRHYPCHPQLRDRPALGAKEWPRKNSSIGPEQLARDIMR